MRDWSFRASPNKTADEQTSTAHLAAKLSATIEASPSEIGAAAINTGLPEWLLVQARGSGRYPASKDVYVSLSKTALKWLGLTVTSFGLWGF
jgi:hypothetical protein